MYVCMHLCMHVYVYVRMYVRMCVCMYVCMCTHKRIHLSLYTANINRISSIFKAVKAGQFEAVNPSLP
jgi:hypothetical protein